MFCNSTYAFELVASTGKPEAWSTVLWNFSFSVLLLISFAVVAFAVSYLPTEGGIILAKYDKICLVGITVLRVLEISTMVKYASPTTSASVSTVTNSMRNNGKSPIAVIVLCDG